MPQIIDCPSPNFDERKLPLSILVLHYTGMQDAASAIARLTDAAAKVSSHYIIAEDGQILRLVEESKRAWHAGRSHWRGIDDVNSASIGIEIVNPGHEFGYRPFTEAQYEALLPLMHDICGRYGITRGNIVGHSDIAPTRKEDPGELFDWERLAKVRLALPRPVKYLTDPHWSEGGFLLALERFGYEVIDGSAAVRAFQRRYRPERIDGEIDGQTRAILLSLLTGGDKAAEAKRSQG
ncbi:N-acetylmuramoyl-L-alanine amidase [Sphingomonas sp. BIUV-7]|uniref:N-acetylmuramoyl-L-alanine amidase n=1 Tax=Sphingomonas natans TaxID=3063330 RepID=A0ABT8Y691_9SPHN|nr:N-acetylmuramoyl-L-alanine amidase [Sphingomonas sp. BIUV-7]MDO6413249.1 N-acetylmuramoyl-L-alanine amidase [Sphingomonas sp. BIUV-7]